MVSVNHLQQTDNNKVLFCHLQHASTFHAKYKRVLALSDVVPIYNKMKYDK